MGNNNSAPSDNRTDTEKILDARKIPRAMAPYFADRKTYATNMLSGMNIPQLPRLIDNFDDLMNKYNHGGFKNTLAGVGKPPQAMEPQQKQGPIKSYKASKKRKKGRK
jgi:hypothetical protein